MLVRVSYRWYPQKNPLIINVLWKDSYQHQQTNKQTLTQQYPKTVIKTKEPRKSSSYHLNSHSQPTQLHFAVTATMNPTVTATQAIPNTINDTKSMYFPINWYLLTLPLSVKLEVEDLDILRQRMSFTRSMSKIFARRRVSPLAAGPSSRLAVSL